MEEVAVMVRTKGKGEWARLVEIAVALMASAHSEQMDKNGRPYLMHPIRVAARMSPNNLGAQVVALLHDTVEDSGGKVTLPILRRYFPERIVQALDAISRREGETYWAYMQRCKQDPLARLVKYADLRDNLDERRRYDGDEGLQQRYKKSLRSLRERE